MSARSEVLSAEEYITMSRMTIGLSTIFWWKNSMAQDIIYLAKKYKYEGKVTDGTVALLARVMLSLVFGMIPAVLLSKTVLWAILSFVIGFLVGYYGPGTAIWWNWKRSVVYAMYDIAEIYGIKVKGNYSKFVTRSFHPNNRKVMLKDLCETHNTLTECDRQKTFSFNKAIEGIGIICKSSARLFVKEGFDSFSK